jgi:hypothetical protein
MAAGRPPRDYRPVIGYSIWGAGTRQDPAVLHFNLAYARSLEEALRRQLPDTVTLSIGSHGLGFDLKGVDPAMSRVDISQVFYELARANNWRTKHYA